MTELRYAPKQRRLITALLKQHLLECRVDFAGMEDLVQHTAKMFKHFYTPRLEEAWANLKLAESTMRYWRTVK
jgi:hypothetical protein